MEPRTFFEQDNTKLRNLSPQELEEQANELLQQHNLADSSTGFEENISFDNSDIEQDPQYKQYVEGGDIPDDGRGFEQFIGEPNIKRHKDPFEEMTSPDEVIQFEYQDLSQEWQKKEPEQVSKRITINKAPQVIPHEKEWQDWSQPYFNAMLDVARFWRDKKNGVADEKNRPSSFATKKNKIQNKLSNDQIRALYQEFREFQKRNSLIFAELMVKSGEWRDTHPRVVGERNVERGIWKKGVFQKEEYLSGGAFYFEHGPLECYFTEDNPEDFYNDGFGSSYFVINPELVLDTEIEKDGVSLVRKTYLVSLTNKKVVKIESRET